MMTGLLQAKIDGIIAYMIISYHIMTFYSSVRFTNN